VTFSITIMCSALSSPDEIHRVVRYVKRKEKTNQKEKIRYSRTLLERVTCGGARSLARCEREACPVRRYRPHQKVRSPSQTGYNTTNKRRKRVSQQIIESVRSIEKVLSTNNVATLQRRFCVPSASRSLAGRKLASGTTMFNGNDTRQ
jgi:coenzyme F420-reducing hydrogenase gamma subunit